MCQFRAVTWNFERKSSFTIFDLFRSFSSRFFLSWKSLELFSLLSFTFYTFIAHVISNFFAPTDHVFLFLFFVLLFFCYLIYRKNGDCFSFAITESHFSLSHVMIFNVNSDFPCQAIAERTFFSSPRSF